MMEENFRFDHRLDYPLTHQFLVFQESRKLTSVGPLICEDFHILSHNNNRILLQLVIRNQGQLATATGIRAELVPLNTAAVHMVNAVASYNDITAGTTAVNSNPYIIDLYWNPGTIDFDLIIFSDGYPYWRSGNLVVGMEPAIEPVIAEFVLEQNYPNPFNPSTVISWQLAVGSPVKLTLYNVTGQKVATLVDERQPAGVHSVEWNASGLASGVYLYKLEAGQYAEVRKMILMK
jgi:hypothetical protein